MEEGRRLWGCLAISRCKAQVVAEVAPAPSSGTQSENTRADGHTLGSSSCAELQVSDVAKWWGGGRPLVPGRNRLHQGVAKLLRRRWCCWASALWLRSRPTLMGTLGLTPLKTRTLNSYAIGEFFRAYTRCPVPWRRHVHTVHFVSSRSRTLFKKWYAWKALVLMLWGWTEASVHSTAESRQMVRC